MTKSGRAIKEPGEISPRRPWSYCTTSSRRKQR